MVRATLRDDYRGPVNVATRVRLDDDGQSSVPSGISDVPGAPHAPGPGGTVNQLVAVWERVPDGVNEESGNQQWKYICIEPSTETVGWDQSSELDNDPSLSVEVATFTVLWPDQLPSIRESAQFQTLKDGRFWSILSIVRHPGRVQLKIRRIDSGR